MGVSRDAFRDELQKATQYSSSKPDESHAQFQLGGSQPGLVNFRLDGQAQADGKVPKVVVPFDWQVQYD